MKKDKKLSGDKLNEAIEKELKQMVDDGIEKSPISNSSLHKRLKDKGFIEGGLSTLSTDKRKALINKYKAEQILSLNLNEKEQQQYINRKTRKALLDKNKALKERIDELEHKLNQNTAILIAVINQIKLKTDLEIDDFLAPHLIPDFKGKPKLKKL